MGTWAPIQSEYRKEKIAKIREDYNKNSGLFYGFFDEDVFEKILKGLI